MKTPMHAIELILFPLKSNEDMNYESIHDAVFYSLLILPASHIQVFLSVMSMPSCYVMYMFRLRLCCVVTLIPVVGEEFSSNGVM
jgi:hypothetical protein